MAVLWCGGEDIDFPFGTGVTVQNSTLYCRSGWARCSINPQGSQGASIRSLPFPGGTVTSAWLSVQVNSQFTNTLARIAGLVQQGGPANGIYACTSAAATQKACIGTYNGTATTVLATEPGQSLGMGTRRIDMQVINYGASGTVNLYVAGNLVVSYTGNITVPSVTAFDTVCLCGLDNASFPMFFSEIIVANESTLGWPGLATLAPSGNGTTQQWQSPAYTNYNPIIINDANSTYTNVVGQDEQATLSPLPGTVPGQGFAVKVVKIIARCAAPTGAVSSNLQLGFKGTSTVAVGSTLAATTGYAQVEQYFATDPTTGGPWLATALGGYQLDMRSA